MEIISTELTAVKSLEGVCPLFSKTLVSNLGLFQDSAFDTLHEEY